MRRVAAKTRSLLIGIVTLVTVTLLTGMGGCDTRYPEDVKGTIVDKTDVELVGDKDFESHNPSLVVEDLYGVQTRIWLKRQYWDGYEVNDPYP